MTVPEELVPKAGDKRPGGGEGCDPFPPHSLLQTAGPGPQSRELASQYRRAARPSGGKGPRIVVPRRPGGGGEQRAGGVQ